MQRFSDSTHHPILLFVGIGPILFRIPMLTGRFCQMACTMVLIYKMPTEQFPVDQTRDMLGCKVRKPAEDICLGSDSMVL